MYVVVDGQIAAAFLKESSKQWLLTVKSCCSIKTVWLFQMISVLATRQKLLITMDQEFICKADYEFVFGLKDKFL